MGATGLTHPGPVGAEGVLGLWIHKMATEDEGGLVPDSPRIQAAQDSSAAWDMNG